jgi:hypothetical protein
MSIVLVVKRDTNCTSILLVVEGIHPARQYCWRWKGYTLHLHILLVVEGIHMHVNTTGGGRDKPCTSILLVVEGINPARQYYWWWKG